MSVDVLLSKLDKVKRVKPGEWKACCPAHGDKRPSLSIAEKPDGRILIHCFSQQCPPEDIMSAVGLTMDDLFPERLGDIKRERRPFSPMEVLKICRFDITVAFFVVKEILKEGKATDRHRKLLVEIAGKLHGAIAISGGDD